MVALNVFGDDFAREFAGPPFEEPGDAGAFFPIGLGGAVSTFSFWTAGFEIVIAEFLDAGDLEAGLVGIISEAAAGKELVRTILAELHARHAFGAGHELAEGLAAANDGALVKEAGA